MTRRNEFALVEYLEHMQQAIHRIQSYTEDVDHAEFISNEEKQDAVIRNLEVVGEAAANIQRHFPDFAVKHPEFPLKAAYGMRNALAHGYFKVDLDVVWRTIEKDVPKLEAQVDRLILGL